MIGLKSNCISFLLHSFLLIWNPAVAEKEEGCSPHADRVYSLPGWDAPLPSAWYSGYLNYELQGQEVHTHYILVEAEFSVVDKPLIYWSNGGPGASSFYGLFTELGPLLLSDDSLETEAYKKTGIPSLIYNPYSWTRLGSILIFDQPAPVGFSYCTNETTTRSGSSENNCGNIGWTDELASENVFMALQEFYKRYPCKFPKSKELFLTGESYAGIYVPTFARRILEQDTDINLKGIAVGDGCLGTHTDICGNLNEVGFGDFWNILFLAGHHQIPLNDFQRVMKACGHHLSNDMKQTAAIDNECQEVLKQVKKETGGYFIYSLYDTCTYRNGLLLQKNGVALNGALNDYACGGGLVLEQYVKIKAVQKALGVQSTFFETDNAGDGFDYTPTEPDLTGFYKDVISNSKIRVLIYNGDTDPAITSFAAQNWTSHLGFEELQHWRPWTIDSCQEMGGYVTRYKDGFDFLTIRGAGHMVPTYKPAATYTFLKTWIIDENDYPIFNVNCTQPPVNRSKREREGKIDAIHSLQLRGENVENLDY